MTSSPESHNLLLTLCFPAADESGIDTSVTNKFPGSTAEYGSKVSGAGNNREIPQKKVVTFRKAQAVLLKQVISTKVKQVKGRNMSLPDMLESRVGMTT